MKTKLRFVSSSVVVALGSAALLSACGGGDYNDTPAPAPTPATSAVPASASTSINGFIAYLQALVVAPADTLEPVDTTNVTAQTDETSEPTPVD